MSNFGRIMQVQILPPDGGEAVTLTSVGDDGRRALTMSARAVYTGSRNDNECTVDLYNVSPTVPGLLQDSGARVRVLAGYGAYGGRPGTPIEVFRGAVLPSSLEGPELQDGSQDWVTRMTLTDGGTDSRDVVVSQSWTSVTMSTVLSRLAQLSGLGVGGIRLGRDPARNRYVVSGTVRDELRRIGEETGSIIQIQGATIEAWPIGGARTESAILVAPDTGLLGIPQRQSDGRWVFVIQAQPGMRAGDPLVVRCPQVQGDMLVQDVVHDLNSRASRGPYRTTVTASQA